MTALLAKAFAEVAKLPPSQQDDFARWMLAELANMRHWNQLAIEKADSLAWMDEVSLEETHKSKVS